MSHIITNLSNSLMALTFFPLIKHFCIIALMSFTLCNSHMCPQSALSISAQCTLSGNGWCQEVCHNNHIAIMWRRHLFKKTRIYENWNMDFAQLWQGFSSFVTSHVGVVLCGPACAVTCVFFLLTPTLIFPFKSGPPEIERHISFDMNTGGLHILRHFDKPTNFVMFRKKSFD